MTLVAPSPTRTERRKALTRSQLLDAAASTMAEYGFHTAKVQDIAARADVGTGTFYNYFRSKDEVFEALIQDTIEGLAAHLDAARAGVADVQARQRAGWRAVLEYADRHRARFRVFFGEGHGFYAFMQRAYDMFAKDIEAEIRAAIAAGVYRPCHTWLMATAAVGMASHVVSWWLDHPDVALETVVEEMTRFEWSGLADEGAAGSAAGRHTGPSAHPVP